MRYYLGNIVSYKALQHLGRVLFQGYVCGLSRKDFGRFIHPKILGASCVFYFIVIDFYIKITRLA